MLFHVTVTHSPEACPGASFEHTPGGLGSAEERERAAEQAGVTCHTALWSTSCLLLGQSQHDTYLVVEAPDPAAVTRFAGSLVPASWTVQFLPVLADLGALQALRQTLATTGASITVPPVSNEPAEASVPESAGESAGEPVAEAAAVQAAPEEAVQAAPEAAIEAAPEVAAEPGDATPPAADDALDDLMSSLETPAEVSVEIPAAPEVDTLAELMRGLDEPAVSQRQPSPPALDVPDSSGVTSVISSFDPAGAGSPPAATPALDDSVTGFLESLDKPPVTAETAPASSGETESFTVPSMASMPVVAAPRLRLRVIVGPATGSTFEFGMEGALIGRSHDNAVFVPDERLSRQHARVTWHNGHFWIEDLGSTNGTAVNGEPLADPHALQSDDSVTLGNTALTIEILS